MGLRTGQEGLWARQLLSSGRPGLWCCRGPSSLAPSSSPPSATPGCLQSWLRDRRIWGVFPSLPLTALIYLAWGNPHPCLCSAGRQHPPHLALRTWDSGLPAPPTASGCGCAPSEAGAVRGPGPTRSPTHSPTDPSTRAGLPLLRWLMTSAWPRPRCRPDPLPGPSPHGTASPLLLLTLPSSPLPPGPRSFSAPVRCGVSAGRPRSLLQLSALLRGFFRAGLLVPSMG